MSSRTRPLWDLGYLMEIGFSNVFAVLVKNEPMPKAPKWHCWVKKENRRS